MKIIPVYPWPPPPDLQSPDGTTFVQAFPASPGVVLALGSAPPWLCDAAVVPTAAGVPAALQAILSGPDDPRFRHVIDGLRDVFGPGVREMTELELRREDLDRD